MRTTLTIDDDVATALKALARNSGKTFKAVVNEVMRRGLMTGEKPVPDREPFRVESVRCGFLPGATRSPEARRRPPRGCTSHL